nr:hypothetical protein [Marinicella sp. W31]MDC2877700.1 hypothetical protein [Marinicella sp. W31]
MLSGFLPAHATGTGFTQGHAAVDKRLPEKSRARGMLAGGLF